jgi:ADP-ribosylglycohydrolase
MSAGLKMSQDHEPRLKRARLSLDGLSVGDAFGDQFFPYGETAIDRIAQRLVSASPWHYTDDTAMALCIYGCLERNGGIERDALAEEFATEYRRDPFRGYGGTAHSILQSIGHGVAWERAAGEVFSGMGSMGNGGAMRVAPLGAYFADDLPELIKQARASAEVTHAHPEGQAGALAVALAAAWAWNHRENSATEPAREMIEFVVAHAPESDTWARIRRTLTFPWTFTPALVGRKVGNGSLVTSPDTVPLAIWCAARHWRNYPEALWNTVSALGDMDTTCAMVGGIVALSARSNAIPDDWLDAREILPV